MNTRTRVASLVSACTLVCLASAAGAEPPPARTEVATTWPQWRGPDRTGAVADAAAWPDSLEHLEKVWSIESLGPSYSGPLITERHVFTTETQDETTEVVTAFDRATGEVAWTHAWPGAMEVPFFAAKSGSWIRSTPATDGDSLFVLGMLEVLVALDAETGKERWRIDFPERFGTDRPPFGAICSPLLAGEHLYLEAADSLFKIAKESGEIVWRSRGFSGGDLGEEGSFSSPVLGELAGRQQLVVQTRLELRGVDPDTGAVLWTQPVPHFRGMNILTPTLWGDHVFTSSYRNGTYLFRVDDDAERGLRSREVWSYKSPAYMSSPVVIDGVAYLHLGSGRLTALDLETGAASWTTKPLGDYWSMAFQGSRVLALAAEGELLLYDASPAEFELIDQRQVADASTWAHLAVAGDEIVVRELDALTVWRWRAAPVAQSDAPATTR